MMTLNNFMEQLSAIQTAADKLSNLIDNGNSYVKVYYCDGYFTLKIFTSESLTNEKYQMDFDRADDLLQHLQVLTIGASLANGEEV